MYSDTDSLIYEIITYNFFNDLLPHFDTSNYPKNHFCFSNTHRNQPGYFKDELKGVILKEFISLRSKLYASKIVIDDKVKKAKGVKKYVIEKHVKFSNYINILNAYINHQPVTETQ